MTDLENHTVSLISDSSSVEIARLRETPISRNSLPPLIEQDELLFAGDFQLALDEEMPMDFQLDLEMDPLNQLDPFERIEPLDGPQNPAQPLERAASGRTAPATKRKRVVTNEDEIMLTSAHLREFRDNYVENMRAVQRKKKQKVTVKEFLASQTGFPYVEYATRYLLGTPFPHTNEGTASSLRRGSSGSIEVGRNAQRRSSIRSNDDLLGDFFDPPIPEVEEVEERILPWNEDSQKPHIVETIFEGSFDVGSFCDLEHLDVETRNFYSYVQNKDQNDLTFEKLVPFSQKKSVAATAFQCVLQLATRDMVKIEEGRAFKVLAPREIRLTVKCV